VTTTGPPSAASTPSATGTIAGFAELPAMDVAGRIGRLRATFDPAGCDALLVTSLVNIRYLTGFTGSAALLLVLADDTLFVTDGRYRDQAATQLAAAGVDAGIEITATGQRELVAAAAAGLPTLGLEAEHVTWAQVRAYDADWFGGTPLVATAGLVEELRLRKDDGEIARIEAAAHIADRALASVRPLLLEAPTEAELGLELDAAMRRLGASGPSFETIVASGPNAAMPHHRPGPRRIGEGDLVVLDFGATVDGYRSDMTRTLMVGEPTATQARMLEVVIESQAAGVAAVGPGVACRDVDAATRAVIAAAGWGDAFVHGTGHGVGLDIHEAPRVGSTSGATLAAGQVVTVEPGVYLPEHGGVRIEDTVVVTDDGCRPLTTTPKTTTVA
jgi:Xaa-Pro aminopeptidase